MCTSEMQCNIKQIPDAGWAQCAVCSVHARHFLILVWNIVKFIFASSNIPIVIIIFIILFYHA